MTIIVCRIRYQSATSSQAGGSWAGKRSFSHCAVPAPFSQLIRDTAGILNLIGPFEAARRFFCTLRQFRQEPRSRFTKGFQVLSSLLLHGNNHGASHVEKIRNYVGAENELR